jgi:hypothetical protein
MEDPYQEAVPEAIAALRAEGYRLMMVTRNLLGTFSEPPRNLLGTGS